MRFGSDCGAIKATYGSANPSVNGFSDFLEREDQLLRAL